MTKFIAHRGYSKYEKENTLKAFIKAGECEYFYGIETDVHKTADNVYIVIHDETTSRITDNRININVEENTYEIVKNINLSNIDGIEDKELKIPLMTEYFETCKKYNKIAVFELKQAFRNDEIKSILEYVQAINYIQNTIFISFNSNNLALVRSLNRDVELQFLFSEFKEEYYEFLVKNNIGIDAWYGCVNKELVEFCKMNNLSTNAWTVDDIKEAKRLMDLGIDYITSNALKSDDLLGD